MFLAKADLLLPLQRPQGQCSLCPSVYRWTHCLKHSQEHKLCPELPIRGNSPRASENGVIGATGSESGAHKHLGTARTFIKHLMWINFPREKAYDFQDFKE